MAKFKNGIDTVASAYQMYGNLHGYLPTKCDPGNFVVDFEITVPTTPLKQSNAEFVFIVYQPQNLYSIDKFRHMNINPNSFPKSMAIYLCQYPTRHLYQNKYHLHKYYFHVNALSNHYLLKKMQPRKNVHKLWSESWTEFASTLD